MRLSVGARIRDPLGAIGTIVGTITDGTFVEVDYDEPQPTHFHDGTPTTARCWCVHRDTLEPADLPALFELADEATR